MASATPMSPSACHAELWSLLILLRHGWPHINSGLTNTLPLHTRTKLSTQDLDQLAAISPALILHSSILDLGAILDSEFYFEQHASKFTQTCFFSLASD